MLHMFGAGNDIQIGNHNGSHSFIDEIMALVTSAISIGGSKVVLQEAAYGDEDMVVSNANGAVELYHDNAKKFETT